MEKFEIKKGEEYIELNNLLKIQGWVGTGGEAKMRIADGEASVNEEKEIRVRKKLRSGDVVTFAGQTVKIK